MPESRLPAKIPHDIETHSMIASSGHLLRRAQQRAVEIFYQEVGLDSLTPRQFALMLALAQNPGASQAALVERTGLDRSTLGEMVARLVGRKLIERRRSGADLRSNRLCVTPEGLVLLRRAAPLVLRAQDRIIAPVPPQHRRIVMAALRLMAGMADEPAAAEK